MIVGRFAALVALLLLAAIPARADSDGGVAASDAGTSSATSRDDDMFGGATPAPTPAPVQDAKPAAHAEPGSADATQLIPVDENAMEQGAARLNDKLTIGGLMYLRLQFDQYQDRAFDKTPLQSPNLLDLYFDARPNDDLRVYVRARLVYNPSLTGGATNQLTSFGALGQSSCKDLCPYVDQFWMKWNIAHKVFFTLGRQHIKWGAGHFWNPTDFLNSQKLNPLDVIDQRLGVDMLKLHVPIESKSFNFYGIVTLDGVSSFRQIGYAGRAEFAAGPTEITASVSYKDGVPLKLGTDISFGVGDFDGYVEGAVLHPVEPGQIVTYSSNPGIDTTTLMFNTPVATDHKNAWLPQVVAGGQYAIKYSDQDSLILGVEYFYNSAGYNTGAYLPAEIFSNNFTPLYNGQHYLAATLMLPNPGNWNNTTFILSWLGNISDRTYVARFDYRITVLTFMQVSAYASYFFGENGEFHFSYSLPADEAALLKTVEKLVPNPIPAQYQSLVSVLQAGIKPDVFQAGVGLILNM